MFSLLFKYKQINKHFYNKINEKSPTNNLFTCAWMWMVFISITNYSFLFLSFPFSIFQFQVKPKRLLFILYILWSTFSAGMLRTPDSISYTCIIIIYTEKYYYFSSAFHIFFTLQKDNWCLLKHPAFLSSIHASAFCSVFFSLFYLFFVVHSFYVCYSYWPFYVCLYKNILLCFCSFSGVFLFFFYSTFLRISSMPFITQLY